MFLLGVGAQKAGTTWLHHYLSGYSEADLGFMKEYHVWDRLTVPELKGYRARPVSLTMKERLQMALWRHGLTEVDRPLVRKAMRSDPNRYFDYFRRLLRRGVSITGDFTPSYNSLPAETMQRIRSGFERRGVKVKAVFLMRDPVERCWSSVRMEQRPGRKLDGTEAEDDALLLAASEDPEYRIRSDYPRTLRNLRDVFAAEDLHVGLYERMFDEDEMLRLGAFLGLEPRFDEAEIRVNVSEDRAGPTAETCRRVAESFRPVYEYCADGFPDTRSLWPNMPVDLRGCGGPAG